MDLIGFPEKSASPIVTPVSSFYFIFLKVLSKEVWKAPCNGRLLSAYFFCLL